MSSKQTNSDSGTDQNFIKRALTLAERGRLRVSPNPMVGAIVVKEGKIVGEGYHKVFGKAHAEVNALDDAGDEALGATLYVTLEPCSRTGKTGPCTERIYEAGISRVVIGMIDPNPKESGRGAEFLRSKGISVEVGVLEERCHELNKGYVKFIQTGLPFITLKIAQTLDGRIATSTGHSKWVTSEEARKMGHRLRSKHDAVLVGIGTVLNDDPHLTLHDTRGPLPRRIVLDSKLRVPLDSNVIADEIANRTIIVTSSEASKEKVQRIVERGSTVMVLNANENGHIPQDVLWKELGDLGITSVLVEGGSSVHTECLKTGYVDDIVIFFAPKLLGTGLDSVGDLGIRNMNQALLLKDLKIRRLSTDIMITAKYDTQKDED